MPSLIAFLGVVLAISVLRRVAPHAGLMDLPGGRRTHAQPVPLVGGLAIGLGLAAALVVRGTLEPLPGALLVAALLVLAGGALDDRLELSARVKLLIQLLAASVMVEFGGALLLHVGALFSTSTLSFGGRFAVPFTVLGLVGVMNALNMIDGADGLAGGVTLTALLWFGVAAALAGLSHHVAFITLVAGAVAAYLCFNAGGPLARRAPVFLGDAGSLLLGLLLAWLAISLTMAYAPALRPITAVWILAVPVCDSVSLMLRRVAHRRSPFAADREHLHHLLSDLGLSRPAAVACMVAVNLTLGGAALLAERHGVPERLLFYTAMVILAAYSAFAFRFYARRASVPPSVPPSVQTPA